MKLSKSTRQFIGLGLIGIMFITLLTIVIVMEFNLLK